jgi:hypothetical protein
LKELIRVGHALSPAASLEKFNDWVGRAIEISGKGTAELKELLQSTTPDLTSKTFERIVELQQALNAEIRRGTAAAEQRVSAIFAQIGSQLPSDFPAPGTIELEDFSDLVASGEPASEAVRIAHTGHLLELQRRTVWQMQQMLDGYLATLMTRDNPATQEAGNLADVCRTARLLVVAQRFLAENEYGYAATAVEAIIRQQVDQLYPPPRLSPIDPRQARLMLGVQPVSGVRRVNLLSHAEEKTLRRAGHALSPETDFEEFGRFIEHANEMLGRYALTLEEERHWNSGSHTERSIERLDNWRLRARAYIRRGIKAAEQKVQAVFAEERTLFPDGRVPASMTLDGFSNLLRLGPNARNAQAAYLLELQRRNVLRLERPLGRYLAALRTSSRVRAIYAQVQANLPVGFSAPGNLGELKRELSKLAGPGETVSPAVRQACAARLLVLQCEGLAKYASLALLPKGSLPSIEPDSQLQDSDLLAMRKFAVSGTRNARRANNQLFLVGENIGHLVQAQRSLGRGKFKDAYESVEKVTPLQVQQPNQQQQSEAFASPEKRAQQNLWQRQQQQAQDQRRKAREPTNKAALPQRAAGRSAQAREPPIKQNYSEPAESSVGRELRRDFDGTSTSSVESLSRVAQLSRLSDPMLRDSSYDPALPEPEALALELGTPNAKRQTPNTPGSHAVQVGTELAQHGANAAFYVLAALQFGDGLKTGLRTGDWSEAGQAAAGGAVLLGAGYAPNFVQSVASRSGASEVRAALAGRLTGAGLGLVFAGLSAWETIAAQDTRHRAADRIKELEANAAQTQDAAERQRDLDAARDDYTNLTHAMYTSLVDTGAAALATASVGLGMARLSKGAAVFGAGAALLILVSAVNHGYNWFHGESGSHGPAATEKPAQGPLPAQQLLATEPATPPPKPGLDSVPTATNPPTLAGRYLAALHQQVSFADLTPVSQGRAV